MVFCGLLPRFSAPFSVFLPLLLAGPAHLQPTAQVRKTTAERLHIRILTIEDKFPGVAVDSVLALLTETAWMGPLEGCLGPRDALYPLLDIPVPAVRMGVSCPAGQDHGAGAGARTGAGSRGETYDSYGALVKEAGY